MSMAREMTEGMAYSASVVICFYSRGYYVVPSGYLKP